MTAQPAASPRYPAGPQAAAAARHAPARTWVAASLRGASVRAIALRAVVGSAVLGTALFAAAALVGGGSAPAPAAPGIGALRVSSGNGIATGFAVADGRVVTVAHVLHGPVTVGGRPVHVLRADRQSDLALLAAPGLHGHAPNITSAANGEHLRVIGVRRGGRSSPSVHVRRSIVAHVRAAGAARAVVRPALELSARIAPGDSGAAVVSDGGALVGVVFAASRNRSDTAYAVDASAVTRLLDRR
jgi:S1-C subfamily serine protease